MWFESPINPTLRCVDVRAVAAACRAAGVISVHRQHVRSPLNQPVLAMGVDLSMQSATKYLNGHSDVTGGVLSGRRALHRADLARTRRLLGGILDPQPAYALGRGAEDAAAARGAAQRQRAGRGAVRSRGIRRWQRVYYPGLASHPDHAIAARQMTGFGGMVCRRRQGRAGGGVPRLRSAAASIKRAASLGGVESLCSLPILTSQYGLDDEELRAGRCHPRA